MAWRDFLGDDPYFMADDPDNDFGNDPFGDEIDDEVTDDEIAEDMNEAPAQGALFPRRQRPLSYEAKMEKLAAKALQSHGLFGFNKIATTRDGEVFTVIRRKGDVPVGQIEYKYQGWRFTPNLNRYFTADELAEVVEFLDEQP